MKINEKIRSLRLERNLTQEDLAKAIGYQGRSAISKIEAGERKISHLMIVKLAHALNVSATLLLCEEDEPFTCKFENVRNDDFIKLFSQLTAEQQDLIIASMKGIIENKL